MSFKCVIPVGDHDSRRQVADMAWSVPPGTTVRFQKDKRSLAQNDAMWVRLTEISEQVKWHGQYLTPEDWKNMFTAALLKCEPVPGLDNGTYVLVGMSTSRMTVGQMSNLIELINAFAAEHGVESKDPE